MITTVKYIVFAILAMAANLMVQRAVFSLWPYSEPIAVALVVGTVIGLWVKYWLDVHWIFYAVRPDFDAAQFVRYALTGVVTTLIFWGAEFGGWYWSRDHLIREIAAILGLSVGYYMKYRLDRRYVFSASLRLNR